MFKWLKNKWDAFQDWFAAWFPGFKTKATAILGVLGNIAFMLQEYIKGLPLEQYFTSKSLLVFNLVLFTLAFWFRSLSDREV